MRLDPEFSQGPALVASFAPSKPNELFTINEALLNDPEWTREMIGSLEDEIKTWEQRAAEIPAELVKLQIEAAECQRDAAVAKLKRIELQRRLAALEGGR